MKGLVFFTGFFSTIPVPTALKAPDKNRCGSSHEAKVLQASFPEFVLHLTSLLFVDAFRARRTIDTPRNARVDFARSAPGPAASG